MPDGPRQADVDQHEVVRLPLQCTCRLADVVRGVADRDCLERPRRDETHVFVVVDDEHPGPRHPVSIGSRSNASRSARARSGVVNGLRNRCGASGSSSP